jgi:hypothetical protein
MPAAASDASRGDARGHGCRLSELSVSGVPPYRSSHGRAVGARGFWIGSSDREVDHGEEVQSEEEIRQEKEGCSGQKEEDTEGVEEEDGKEGRKEISQEGEEGREQAEKGCACAEAGSEARARSNARTGARAGLDSDKHGTGRRRQYRRLICCIGAR